MNLISSRHEIEWHLQLAHVCARQELIVAARAPGLELIGLLNNRSAQLARDEAELATILSETPSSVIHPSWGAFS